MIRLLHFAAPPALAAIGVYRELWDFRIPGTGNSIMELLRLGYPATWLARYVPWQMADVGLFSVALAWCLLASCSGRKRERVG